MKYVIIGTAGHVDHGKTALIKALTGTDTDRLKEEKARGISIDLGFASLRIGNELTAGLVDVPGHERFIKNMLAGSGGIDMALLVVAADEGVMPQTREHLVMLELIGVRRGIVVLSKIDKTDIEWLELVIEDVKALIDNTFLNSEPICRVSAVSGAGLSDLRNALLSVIHELPVRDSSAPFRLWIDRVFSVKGHGTVVTGSVLSGSVDVGENVACYPSGNLLRVRGLESHGEKVKRIYAGQRAAINLGGEGTEELERGMALGSPVRGLTSTTWNIKVWWLHEFQNGMRIRLHIGTGEFLGRIYKFKDQSEEYVRLILERPLTAGLGDRGIIRQYSPQHLLGGMMIIAPGKPTRKLSDTRIKLAKALNEQEIDAIIYYVIADNDHPEVALEIKRQSGYLSDKAVEDALDRLVAAKKVQSIGSFYLTSVRLDELKKKLCFLVGQYHEAEPGRLGLSKDILCQNLHLKERFFDNLLSHLQNESLLVVQDNEVSLMSFVDRHSDWWQRAAKSAQVALGNIGLISVDHVLLAEKMSISIGEARSLHVMLLKKNLLIRIGNMYIYKETIKNILQLLRQRFAVNQTIAVAELRDMLGTSRKIALELLEYFDANKYTFRQGDSRRQGSKLSSFD